MGCGASNTAANVVSNSSPPVNTTISSNQHQHGGRGTSRPVIKSKSYKHGSPITLAELTNQRTEYWATRTEGNSHMWNAIQSAADAVLLDDLTLANAILEASEITTPNGLLEVLYDNRGYQYKVPIYCIANPVELVQSNASAELAYKNISPNGSTKMGIIVDNTPPITIRIRINPGDLNMKVQASPNCTINDLKSIISNNSEQPCEEDRQRIIFMGRELKNAQKISDVGFEENKVVQVFLRPSRNKQ
mmetsp:Transcript_95/g.139  ORF Transcript_95/g.139 Transcript_95/m.139 type:complete len:247 (+) Transcript_95:163-903(+)|eukprot:CAMPEP_0170073542 /NCGR_PEP_ID=MMETSP0019_2-20121128/10939_1 /TAXON_ID=98059 /ORGANISM="Dinobryon sp., Strain UTEXLB2267" /LENGTH=246 /DNA_ID=CAMNT_0010283135 /DNA_START=85 /DNA_END=825 /DNA_ORIENTATION=+